MGLRREEQKAEIMRKGLRIVLEKVRRR